MRKLVVILSALAEFVKCRLPVMASSLLKRLVDPSCWWRGGWSGPALKALWMSGMRSVEHRLTMLEDLMMPASMQVSRP